MQCQLFSRTGVAFRVASSVAYRINLSSRSESILNGVDNGEDIDNMEKIFTYQGNDRSSSSVCLDISLGFFWRKGFRMSRLVCL